MSVINKLNAEQQLAVDKITKRNFKYFGLTGAGGTGKTHCLKYLPRYLKIAYTAPTNKAVSVLIDSDLPEQDCFTIYAFMGLQVNEANGKVTIDKKNKSKAHRYDILVIDESSMISKELLDLIISMAMSHFNLRIIFMGDSYQLPPIGEQFSNAFKIVDDSVHLTKQMRQSAKTHPLTNLLDDLRLAIDDNRKIDFASYNAQIVDTVSGHKVGIIVTNKQDRFNNWILKSHDDDRGYNNTVIAYTNNKVDAYNNLIHEEIYNDDEPYSNGEKIIVQKPVKMTAMHKIIQDHKSTMYNIGHEIIIENTKYLQRTIELGKEKKVIDCVIITDSENGNQLLCLVDTVDFNNWFNIKAIAITRKGFDDSYNWQMLYAIRDSFAQVRLGYAITAHKSQGSTYDNVFIDIPNIQSMRESQKIINNCLYVAISRAKNTVVLLIN